MRDHDLLERRRALLYTVMQAEKLYRPDVAFSYEDFECLVSDLRQGRPNIVIGSVPDLTGIINAGALMPYPVERRTIADYVDDDEDYITPPRDDFLYLFGAGYISINDDFEIFVRPKALYLFPLEHIIKTDCALLPDTDRARFISTMREEISRRENDYSKNPYDSDTRLVQVGM